MPEIMSYAHPTDVKSGFINFFLNVKRGKLNTR